MAENTDARVRTLFDQAGRLFAQGRAAEADRLAREAAALAPDHPLVLNERGAQRLGAGDPAGALALLQAATAADPAFVPAWMNLAIACRGLRRPAEERAALDAALKLDPHNLRALLQAASLHETQGESRAAAATYRTALQSIPRDQALVPELRAQLAHAQGFVERSNRELESFLDARLAPLREQADAKSRRRFDKCMGTLVRRDPVYRQRPTFMYFPELPAIEFYDRADFPWLDAFEAATDDIRAEFLQVMAEDAGTLEPYIQGLDRAEAWRELNGSRRWSVYYLWRAGSRCDDNLRRCPKTAKVLEAWPRCELPGSGPSCVFSILDARTHIPPHSGVNNARLLCHLPLVVPPGCWFRVGSERREWVEGEAFVFDDTIEHEAMNGSDVSRAVMIFDIWNPLVSEAERAMVRALTEGVGEFYGSLPSYV